MGKQSEPMEKRTSEKTKKKRREYQQKHEKTRKGQKGKIELMKTGYTETEGYKWNMNFV